MVLVPMVPRMLCLVCLLPHWWSTLLPPTHLQLWQLLLMAMSLLWWLHLQILLSPWWPPQPCNNPLCMQLVSRNLNTLLSMVDDPVALPRVTQWDILTRGGKWSLGFSTMSLFPVILMNLSKLLGMSRISMVWCTMIVSHDFSLLECKRTDRPNLKILGLRWNWYMLQALWSSRCHLFVRNKDLLFYLLVYCYFLRLGCLFFATNHSLGNGGVIILLEAYWKDHLAT